MTSELHIDMLWLPSYTEICYDFLVTQKYVREMLFYLSNIEIVWLLGHIKYAMLSDIHRNILHVLCRPMYRHLTYIWSHYYWVNTPRYITQNSLSNNISTKMYFKSKTKQYLRWCFNIVLWLITLCLRFLSKQYGWLYIQ